MLLAIAAGVICFCIIGCAICVRRQLRENKLKEAAIFADPLKNVGSPIKKQIKNPFEYNDPKM